MQTGSYNDAVCMTHLHFTCSCSSGDSMALATGGGSMVVAGLALCEDLTAQRVLRWACRNLECFAAVWTYCRRGEGIPKTEEFCCLYALTSNDIPFHACTWHNHACVNYRKLYSSCRAVAIVTLAEQGPSLSI